MNWLFILLVVSGALCLAYLSTPQKVATFTKEEESLIVQGVLAEWTKQCERGVDNTKPAAKLATLTCCITKGVDCEIKQGRASEISGFCSKAMSCCSEFSEAESKGMTLTTFMEKQEPASSRDKCAIAP